MLLKPVTFFSYIATYSYSMNIGFDAKRAFHNHTGLGNYSRTLIESLSNYFPDEHYFLFNPKKSDLFKFNTQHVHEVNPEGLLNSLFPSYWRSKGMIPQIEHHVDLYHGLSNELPFGIHRSKVRKVVTIHDLIYEFYPQQYRDNDIRIYRKKFKYACEAADRIIAISESTRQDLIETYQLPSDKIEVCYQSCESRYFTSATDTHKHLVAAKYQLHKPYFLSVGSIIERKNLLNTCKAFAGLKQQHDIQLVIIGKGNGRYKQEVTHFIQSNQLQDDVIFLEDRFMANEVFTDLPTLYQSALALVYPSIKEGFGIPVLEAQASGTVAITSNCSSLPEAGGEACLQVNPQETNEIFNAMYTILHDEKLTTRLVQEGIQHAQLFNHKITCEKVMNVYKKLI